MPRGELLRPLLMSETEPVDRPTAAAIAVRDQPLSSSSLIRVDQSSMRQEYGIPSACQRHSVPEFRNHEFMETIGDRVRKRREQLGIDAKTLAMRAKLAYSTLKDLENNRQASTTKMPALIRELRTNATWLETGKGSPDVAEVTADLEWSDVLGYAQQVGLGEGPEANEYAETHKLKFRADSLQRKRLSPAHLAVMYGKGESMLPRIHSGDAILFDKSDTRPLDEALFVVLLEGVAGESYSVKRCREFGHDIYFDALNPEGDHNWRKPRKMDDPKHPIQIIGRVRWIGSWEG